VFDVPALPADIRAVLPGIPGMGQLHLFGHGGRALWRALKDSGFESPEPVDDFSAATVRRYFAEGLEADYRLLFPDDALTLPLQQLGELAGWHHDSPFRVGVNRRFGSWFAYRAVALAATRLPVTPKAEWGAACPDCAVKPCINACPAGALVSGSLELDRCIDYRLSEGSACADRCVARLACPVGCEHRYDREQVAYHYGRSLITLRAWRQG